MSQDSAGGLITSTAQSSVFVNGRVWAVQGAIVAPHGTGPHAAATMQGAELHRPGCGEPGVSAGRFGYVRSYGGRVERRGCGMTDLVIGVGGRIRRRVCVGR